LVSSSVKTPNIVLGGKGIYRPRHFPSGNNIPHIIQNSYR
jgi:hypothetical protein